MSGLQLYLKKTPAQVFFYEICEIFKNTFFYKTAVLWWLLLAVNCVHTEDIHWKFMLPKKKWYNWTVLLRLVFLDKEYSSKVFQTLLAEPHFSEVAVAEVFCKKGVPENFANHSCFPVNFAKFSRTPSVAASKKLKAEAVIRRCSVKQVVLEISLNSQKNTCARVSNLQL